MGVDCISIKGMWWDCAMGSLVTGWLVWVCNYYYKHVKYICPECHQEFKPGKKEAFFAKHTTTPEFNLFRVAIKDSVLKSGTVIKPSGLIVNRSWTNGDTFINRDDCFASFNRNFTYCLLDEKS